MPLYVAPDSPTQRAVFSPAVPWLREDGTCGEFVRRLIGALHAGLPYVRQADTQRLIAMLYEFLRWENPRAYASHIPAGPLEDLPLTYLGFYVRHWLHQRWQPPILAYAALEAAWFIEVHFTGHRFLDDPAGEWEIEACRPPDLPRDERRAEGFDVLHDSRFKKDFTEAYGRLLVECEVPVGGSLTIGHYSSGGEDRVLGEGVRFRFGIERCPLSTTQSASLVYYALSARSPNAFDLCSRFCGWGVLLPPHSDERIASIGDIPLSWVIAAESRSEKDPFDREPKPLPAWLRPVEPTVGVASAPMPTVERAAAPSRESRDDA